MERCNFLDGDNVLLSYGPDTGYRCDGTNQCWITDTGLFTTRTSDRHYCIFHAPDNLDATGRSDWSVHVRRERQSQLLVFLIREWCKENKERQKSGRRALTFVLPHVKCGGLDLSEIFFAGALDLQHARFEGDVSFKGADFQQDTSFAHTRFGGVTRFEIAEFRKRAVFDGTTFDEDAWFPNTCFRGPAYLREVAFSKEAYFYESKFGRVARFSKSRFWRGADFKESRFLGEAASYCETRFDGVTVFTGIKVRGKADFKGAGFGGRSEFISARFGNQTDFSSVSFHAVSDFQGARFFGAVTFSEAGFQEEADFCQMRIRGESKFDNVRFAKNARFLLVPFGGMAWFRHATFGRDAGFDGAQFAGGASFDDATFGRYASFFCATFSGDLSCRSAKFDGEVGFKDAQFNNDALFGGADFKADVDFSSGLFLSGLSLSRCKFGGRLVADTALFLGTLLLGDNQFDFPATVSGCAVHRLTYRTHKGERLFFNGCHTVYFNGSVVQDAADGKSLGTVTHSPGPRTRDSAVLDFERQHCALLTFQNMDLSRADFAGADLSGTRFISCRWNRPDGRYADAYLSDHYRTAGTRKDVNALRTLRDLYRQLMRNLEDQREFAQAGDFHYREMLVRLALLRLERKWTTERVLLSLYGAVAEFGENYKSLAFWMVWSLVFFPCVAAGLEPPRSDVTTVQVLKDAFFGLVPWAFKASNGLTSFWAKAVILFGQLTLLTLTTLFVMAVRRRFRR